MGLGYLANRASPTRPLLVAIADGTISHSLISLASVQEQRLPPNEPSVNEESLRSADISVPDKVSCPIDKSIEIFLINKYTKKKIVI